MVFRQHILSITTLTIIYNISVLIFLNFNLIPSVKVSSNSDILTHFNPLRLNMCQETKAIVT